MNVVDTTLLIVVAFFVLIFAIKGFRKIFFSIISCAIALCLASLFGESVGILLGTDGLAPGFAGFSEETVAKLNSMLSNFFGAVIVFLLCFIVFRLLFKVVEMKMNLSVHSVVINRLLGALAGLIVGIGFIFVLSFVLEVFATVLVRVSPESDLLVQINNSKIWNFIKNLN